MSDFRIIPDNEIDAWLTVASVESAAIIRQLRAERDEARANVSEIVIAENVELRAKLKTAKEALRLMLTDYRSEGCADPDCRVCKASKAAEASAKAAINESR